jgi:hypothetical protein
MKAKTDLKLFIVVLTILFPFLINSQTLVKEGAPNIFLSCRCDMDYIKQQIPVVNYVGDRADADIHILFTDQRTGSGGREYLVLFIGQKNYSGVHDTIKYVINQIDTEDQRRIKMVDALKAGLAKYIFQSRISDQMNITFKNGGNSASAINNDADNWDSWVFRTSVNTSLNGQQTTNSQNIGGSFSANRVTEESKIFLWASTQYNESNYDYDDTKIKSVSRRNNFSASYVGAIDEHWSWGVETGVNQSTYSNIKLGVFLNSGVEYNFFPYSEANQRQLKIEYQVNAIHNNYRGETIYLKMKEGLFRHSLKLSLELIEQWGNIGFRLSGSNYLHDFNLYSLTTDGFVSLRLVKGLALDIKGRYSKINNQIALPRGQASLEEVLLQRKEIATQFSYEFQIGLSYSFGSIYNNAINPRFDD